MDAPTAPPRLLLPVAVRYGRRLASGEWVWRRFVVPADPNDPARPDMAELERRVAEWKEQQS